MILPIVVRFVVTIKMIIVVPLPVLRLFLFVIKSYVLSELSSYIFEVCVFSICFGFVTLVNIVIF